MKLFQLLPLIFIAFALSANPNQKVLENTENYVFKETPNLDLKIYVFKPDAWNASQENPAIVFYFGGGWNSRHITQFVAYAQYYVSKGFVCFIPNYRVRSTDNSQALDSVRDAQDAFAYVRKNVKQFGIDSSRIAASGGSAGGHLAASLGTLKDSKNKELSKPNALILFNPVCVVDSDKNPKRYDFARLGAEGHEISPYHNVSDKVPPTIIYHGTEDRLVPYQTAKMFHEKMLEAGNDCTLIPFEGKDHGFFNHGKHLAESDYRKTLNYTDEFLSKIGWMSAN
ncbi:MAG: alpha/beta hydrolase [Opitutae bacterium]|nr:alpha/beta hydrolase [Opitutae bacterium]